jgi:hypothetical protein
MYKRRGKMCERRFFLCERERKAVIGGSDLLLWRDRFCEILAVIIY